jgi:endonuclease/exonuclease/phosphatase family metal-dependent hydrolase
MVQVAGRFAATSLVTGLALAAGLVAVSPAGRGEAAVAAGRHGTDVRVGTFNVVGVNGDDKASGPRKVWRDRRSVVIGEILAQRLDVVGLQEVNQSLIYGDRLVDDRRNQYLDLLHGLNKAGGRYAVTSIYPYNCYRPFTDYKCRYRNRAASGDNRIFYNIAKFSLVSRGAYLYPHQLANKSARRLAWAVLRSRATGHDLLFTTTHLDPYSKTVRVRQWRDMIHKINAIKGHRPVIVTGDFNSTKYDPWAASMLPAMVRNGYGDALGQHYRTNPGQLRPVSTRHAWVNSYGAWRRKVGGYVADAREETDGDPGTSARTGNGLDWIFASNSLPVREYEVVTHMNEADDQVEGTIPSDHNMVRATITVP